LLKIIGSVLVIGCCTILGYSASGRTKQRIKALRGLLSALTLMKSEICDLLTPMPELLKLLSQQVSAPASLLFSNCHSFMFEGGSRSFRDSWRRAVLETRDLCLLSEEEEVLCELGVSLGRYNIEEQRKAIEKAEKRLELFLELEEKDKKDRSKINTVLGLGTGVTLAILLF
jgi:stage III sporulation protein AB